MATLSLFRGNTSAVNSKQLKDGQLLVDTQAGAVKVDVLQSGTVQRITVSGAGGASTQSDYTETDSTASSFIKNKPTKTSDFSDTLFVYSNTEPTTDLVDGKTEWLGGDGRVELTFINMDGSTYMTYLGRSGDTFPTIPDPVVSGYEFDSWNPTLPSVVPNENTTYIATAVSAVTVRFIGDRQLVDPVYTAIQVMPGTVITQEYVDSLGTPPNWTTTLPPYEEHRFVKWLPTFPITISNQDYDIDSKWERQTQVRVYQMYNYGSIDSDSKKVVEQYCWPNETFPSYTLDQTWTVVSGKVTHPDGTWINNGIYSGEPPATIPSNPSLTYYFGANYTE